MRRSRGYVASASQAARRNPLKAGLAAAAALCLVLVLFVDEPLARAMREMRDSETTAFFRVITDIAWGLPWILLSALAAAGFWAAARRPLQPDVRARYRRYARAGAYAFSTLIAAGAALHVLKFLFSRWRPRYMFDEEAFVGFNLLGFLGGGANSFPSGHAQVAMTVATILVVVLPRYDLAWIGLGLLIAFARVPVGSHFLSDVIAGGFLGIATAVLMKQAWEARGEPLKLTFERDWRLLGHGTARRPPDP